MTSVKAYVLDVLYACFTMGNNSVKQNHFNVFAGTSAKVSFILTGDQDETAPRMVEDPKRPILERSNADTFIMAVPQPLGTLTHLRYETRKYLFIFLYLD